MHGVRSVVLHSFRFFVIDTTNWANLCKSRFAQIKRTIDIEKLMFETILSAFWSELDGLTIAVLSLVSIIMMIRFIQIAKDEFSRSSGFLMPTKDSGIYKRWVKDFGIDDYDKFQKYYKSKRR